MTAITAASVSSHTHAGIYYAPAHLRRGAAGRNIRLVNRDRLPAIRTAYKVRRRADHISRDVIRVHLTALLSSAARDTIRPTGELLSEVGR